MEYAILSLTADVFAQVLCEMQCCFRVAQNNLKEFLEPHTLAKVITRFSCDHVPHCPDGHMTFWLLRTHGHMTSTATNPCAVGRQSHDLHAVITCLVIGWVSHASRITTYGFKDEKKNFFAQLSTVIKYTRCS